MSTLKIYSPAIVLVLIALGRLVLGIGESIMVISPLLVAATVVIHIREEHRRNRQRRNGRNVG